MELHAVYNVYFWVSMFAFIGCLAGAMASAGPDIDSCLKLSTVTIKPVVQWSKEDLSSFVESIRRCDDVSDFIAESTCPSREYTIQFPDCCQLVDALLHKLRNLPQDIWTPDEREKYRRWLACCKGFGAPAEDKTSNNLAGDSKSQALLYDLNSHECCLLIKDLNTRPSDEWTASERANYGMWLPCCKGPSHYVEEETSSVADRKFKPHSKQDSAQCCEEVWKLRKKGRVHWSPEDKTDYLKWLACCNTTSLHVEEKTSSIAARKDDPTSSECCANVIDLRKKGRINWTEQDKADYQKWLACCGEDPPYVEDKKQQTVLKPTRQAPHSCCKHSESLSCVRKSGEGWKFEDKRSYEMWANCCLEHLEARHKDTKSGPQAPLAELIKSLPSCCTVLQGLV